MKKLYPPIKVYIKNSGVRNPNLPKETIERGVFADQNIKKGETIEVCPLIIVPKSDMSNLSESILTTYFFYFGKKKEKLAMVLGFGSLYNHSHKPNATYKMREREKTIEFTSIKDIKKGEEITFNYSHGNPKGTAPLWFEIS